MRKHLLVLAAALALTFLVAACGGSDDSSGGEGSSSDGGGESLELKVGVVASLTGPNAVYGVENANAAELAAEDINAAGEGVQISLVGPNDSQSTPASAVSATQRAIGDGAQGLVGYELTEMGQAATPVIGDLPALFTGVTELEDRQPNIFTFNAPSAPMMKVLVEEVLEPKDVKRVGIIYQQQPTLSANAAAMKTAAEEAGMTVVANEGASLTATDFNAQVTNVLAEDPDAVSVQGVAAPSGTIVSALRQRGFKGLIVAQLGVASPTFVETAGDAADGVVFPVWWDIATSNQQGKEVYDEYLKKFGNPPLDFIGMAGYAGVEALADAAKIAGSTDAAAISEALNENTFDGPLGEVRFEDGIAQIEPSLVVYENGKTQPYKGH